MTEEYDPQKLRRLARQAMSSEEYRKKFRMADFWGESRWYPPQREFFRLGAKHHQRLLRGGNQGGKSTAGGYEISRQFWGHTPRGGMAGA
jgi:hypothetical protein